MDTLSSLEYRALRDTIRTRGGARPLALLLGLGIWASLLVAVLVWLPNPIASVIPLLLLVATFEVVRTLHLSVERIGRYVQVFFEEGDGGRSPTHPPAWEHTAMVFGPRLPGAGGHPLFLPIVVFAAIANYLAVLMPGPVPVELLTLAVPHLACIVWMIVCDRGMRAQRTTELARYRALKESLRSVDSLRP